MHKLEVFAIDNLIVFFLEIEAMKQSYRPTQILMNSNLAFFVLDPPSATAIKENISLALRTIG